jgi:hypothetical protein
LSGDARGEYARYVSWPDVVRFRIVPDECSEQSKGIGDVNGTTKGSAARFNTGKPDLSLVPLRDVYEAHAKLDCWNDDQAAALECLFHMAVFQETGECIHLHAAMVALGQPWDSCAKVLEYGKRKYSPWNWARGQQWSVCLASGARHIVFGILVGEVVDPESLERHEGHVMANLCFLSTFTRVYPEGNDLPVQWLKAAA